MAEQRRLSELIIAYMRDCESNAIKEMRARFNFHLECYRFLGKEHPYAARVNLVKGVGVTYRKDGRLSLYANPLSTGEFGIMIDANDNDADFYYILDNICHPDLLGIIREVVSGYPQAPNKAKIVASMLSARLCADTSDTQ